MHQKLAPGPFLILLNSQNSHRMQEILFNIRYFFKEDYQKAFKKLTLFFLSNPGPFNGQNCQKQKESRTSDKSLFRLQSKFRNIPLFVIYYQIKFDDVM